MAKVNANHVYVPGAKAIRFQLEPVTVDPSGAELIAGRMWYNTVENVGKYFDGTNVVPFPSDEADTDVTVTASPTGVDVQSGTGTTDTIPLADATNAGVMSPADKTKLDGLSNIAGQFIDTVATSAALDALTDTKDGSSAVEAGDWAILAVDDGGREAGIYFHDGTNWAATAGYQFPDTVTAATDTVVGIVELATTVETTTGTDTTRAVTPAGVAAALDSRTFTAQFGDGTAGPFVLAHGLGSASVDWHVKDAAGMVIVDGTVDATNITISPIDVVSANEYTVYAQRY